MASVNGIPFASVNSTDRKIPFNNRGNFTDSNITQGSNYLNLNNVPPSVFAGYAPYNVYNINFSQEYWSIGIDNGNIQITDDYKFGVNMNYSSFEMFAGFGKIEGNGVYSRYSDRTTIGAGGNFFGVSSDRKLYLSSGLVSEDPNGVSQPVWYYFLTLNVEGNQYRIPLMF